MWADQRKRERWGGSEGSEWGTGRQKELHWPPRARQILSLLTSCGHGFCFSCAEGARCAGQSGYEGGRSSATGLLRFPTQLWVSWFAGGICLSVDHDGGGEGIRLRDDRLRRCRAESNGFRRVRRVDGARLRAMRFRLELGDSSGVQS